MGSLADRLRDEETTGCYALHVMKVADPDGHNACVSDCRSCWEAASHILADAIEAEEAKIAVDAMREAVEGAKPQLPEGVIWPTFDDGQPVMFGDEIEGVDGKVCNVSFCRDSVHIGTDSFWLWRSEKDAPPKRRKPDVLGADGVKINVGDTVYDVRDGAKWTVSHIENADMVRLNNAHQVYANNLTHRKPDTQEDIDADCMMDAKDYCEKHGIKDNVPGKHWGKLKCEHLVMRQRKLLGGE